MDALLQDLRYAIRTLRKSPGFTTVAVLTLTLAIGANTAIFSLIDAVLVRPLPVRQPHELVEVSTVTPSTEHGGFTFQTFQELERQQHVFSDVIGWFGDGIFNVETSGQLARGDVWAVTGNFYTDLDVAPAAGRLLRPDDAGVVPASVAVLGYGFWHGICHGDLAVIGKTVMLEGERFTIVGIAPRGFTGFGLTTEPDVTIPLTAAPLLSGHILDSLTTSSSAWVRVIGRLKAGVTVDQARSQLTAVWPVVKRVTVPTSYVGAQREKFLATSLTVRSAATGIDYFLRSHFTRPLYVVMGIAALILLIACVNLASLLLTRAVARIHEVGIKTALGATRRDVARPVFVEALLLAIAGTAGAGVFAYVTSRALSNFMLRDYLVPASLNVTPDVRVIGFGAISALVVAFLCSVAPIWHVTRNDSVRMLGHGERVAGTGRLGRLLVSLQVALGVVLLLNTILLVRTLQQIRAVDAGFESEHVIVAALFPVPNGYKNLNNDTYYPLLMDRVLALRGVRAAGLSNLVPGSGFTWKETASTQKTSETTNIVFDLISPGFFNTLGIRVLQGRDMGWADNRTAPPVAIITRSLATRFFPDSYAVGRHIRVGTDPKRQDLEIVGIVNDVRHDMHDANPFVVYAPLLQAAADLVHWGNLFVRTESTTSENGELRTAIQSLGHEYILQARSLRRITERGILQERVTAWLAAFFGSLALLLVGLGLFGLMSYTVTQRSHEIGIRMALGATARQTAWLIVTHGLATVMLGLSVGVAVAFASLRLVRSLLFGIALADPTALAVTLILIMAVTVLACWLPARRAARVDPAIALRAQ